LGDGETIPTGAQTVAIDQVGTFDMVGVCITVTADGDTELAGTTGFDSHTGSTNDFTLTVTGVAGECWHCSGMETGLSVDAVTVTSDETAVETYVGNAGSFGLHVVHHTDASPSGNPDIRRNWTIGDEAAATMIALQEKAAAGGGSKLTLLGVG
jgi:hypothetical protein